MRRSLDIIDPRIEEYLLRITPPSEPVLAEMESLGAQRGFPIVGPLVGRLLFLLARTIDARKVLELGSGYGYSACWFAAAVGPQGQVLATENSHDNAALAGEFLGRAGLSGRVSYRIGEALAIARELEGPFDVVFNDIDKQDYPKTLSVARRLVRPGGLFISDNMLWYGNVVTDDPDPTSRGVRELTRMLYSSKEFFTTLIPLRDGVTVSLRVG